MSDSPPQNHRKLGRPPDARAEETWARIIVAARELFGRNGYHATTLKDIAAQTGTTAGALYYYCSSKKELFAAVVTDTWRVINDVTNDHMRGRSGFVDRMRGFLEASAQLQELDPTLGPFITTAEDEAARDAELRQLLRSSILYPLRATLGDIVAEGVSTGELRSDLSQEDVTAMLLAVVEGLARSSAWVQSPGQHRRVVEALGSLLDGSLVQKGGRNRGAPKPPRRARVTRTPTSGRADA